MPFVNGILNIFVKCSLTLTEIDMWPILMSRLLSEGRNITTICLEEKFAGPRSCRGRRVGRSAVGVAVCNSIVEHYAMANANNMVLGQRCKNPPAPLEPVALVC